MNVQRFIARHWKLSSRFKFLNSFLIVAMLLGMLSPAALAAPLVGCQVSTAPTIYLPMASRQPSLVTSVLQRVGVLEPSAPTARQLQYQVGKTYSYDWNVKVDTKSTGRDNQGSIEQQGQQTTVIHAIADVMIKEKLTDGTFSGQVTLRDSFICATDGKTDTVTSDTDLVNALKTPVLFKQTPAGKISEVSVAQGAPALATNLQKGIVNALQLTLRDNENAYEVEEDGGQGSYKVKYALTDGASELTIGKSYNRQSFTTLISSGTTNNDLTMQNIITVTLSNTQGVITSLKSTESMQSGDGSTPSSTGGPALDGVAAWSTARTETTLKLLSVSAADLMAAANPNLVYELDTLGAELNEQYQNPNGIDLSKVNLDAEMTALEQAPTNPGLVMRIADLVRADVDQNLPVLKKIQARIQANASNDAIVTAYIDALIQVGTSEAQNVINGILGNSSLAAADLSATLTITSQEHALIATVLLSSPTITTVETIKTLSNNANSSLQDTAISALGAAADNTSDPKTAGEIVQQLTAGLGTASQGQNQEDVILFLNALGNTGEPSTLSTIQQVISTTAGVSGTTQIQIAALTALRKIPGTQAEGLMLGALNKTNEQVTGDPDLMIQREMAYALLSSRSDLSESAAASLSAYKQLASLPLPSGYYTFNWNRHLGGSTIGVNLPGYLGVATPSAYLPFLYVRQQADAHIWSYTRQLIYGDLLAKSTGSAFQFRAYLALGGNLLQREYNASLPCSYNNGGNLYNTSITAFNVTYSIPIFAVITINFNVRGSGWFSLDWHYDHNVCSGASGKFIGRIVPQVWARAEASAYLGLVLVRGGITLEADLLRTSLPAEASVVYSNNTTSFCLSIKAVTQALSGRLYAWADVVKPRWGVPPWHWVRIGDANLWTFSTPTGTYDLYVRCF